MGRDHLIPSIPDLHTIELGMGSLHSESCFPRELLTEGISPEVAVGEDSTLRGNAQRLYLTTHSRLLAVTEYKRSGYTTEVIDIRLTEGREGEGMELAQLTEIDVQPFLTRSFEGFALTLGSVLILGLQDNAFIALEPEAIEEEVTSTIGNRDLRRRIDLSNVLAPYLSPYWDFLHSEAIEVGSTVIEVLCPLRYSLKRRDSRRCMRSSEGYRSKRIGIDTIQS